MADDRTRLAQDVERELREHLPARVFKTVVPRSVRVAEAPTWASVSEHAPRSTGSAAYRAFADEVLALGLPMAEPAVINAPMVGPWTAASSLGCVLGAAMALPFSATCVLAMLGFRSSMITTLEHS